MQLEKWQRDLEVYKDINTTFVIEGNVHDKQPWIYQEDDYCEPISLSLFMYRFLIESGYDIVVFFNPVDGLYNSYDNGMVKKFAKLANIRDVENISVCDAISAIRIANSNTMYPVAVVFEMANTLAIAPDNLSMDEEKNYSKLMMISKTPVQAISTKVQKPLTNLMFLVTDKANDIPAWFYINNPYVKTLMITKPETQIRASIIRSRMSALVGVSELSEQEREEMIESFALLTDGMSLVELDGVVTLCRQQNISIEKIKDAVFMFRYGLTESHWDKLDMGKIQRAPLILSERVKGQKEAVSKTANILSRACLGLSGIQGGSSSRPKGVLFFAGPTGTGKTELAKAIAELVFGDESFLTRFDMSEYGQSHSDQKLLGAPPGYVGYGAGGQLTNAVKEKPFSVLLFDEIEKAHPSILDKFLQILEDGRLTDSSGETVYFSETLIIFTSNLGITKSNGSNRHSIVTADMPYEDIRDAVTEEIKAYFKYEINRPEILNRIGDNLVIFDFIHEQGIGEILYSKVKDMVDSLYKDKQIALHISEAYMAFLNNLAVANLENGGRGVGNIIEAHLVNVVAHILAEHGCKSNAVIKLNAPPIKQGDMAVYEISRNEAI